MAAMVSAALATTVPPPAISVREIVEVADIATPTISPDGRFVAFRIDRSSIARNRHELFWYVAPVDGPGPAREIASGGSGLFASSGALATEAPVWSRDSRSLYFRALIGGEVQVWRASIDKNDPHQMTTDGADVRSFALATDGRSLIYRTGATRTAIAQAETRVYDSGVLVDATVDLALGVSGGAIVNGRPASQRLTGHWFERRGLLGDEPDQVKALALDGVARVGTPVSGSNAGATPVAVSSSMQAPSVEAGKRKQLCKAIDCGGHSIVRLQPIPGSTDVLVTAQTTAFQQSLYRWHPGSRSARILVRSDGLVAGSRDLGAPCGLTSAFAFCVLASATEPPQLVRLSLTDGAQRKVIDPNRALRSRIVTSAQLLTWRDADGRQFTGQLLLPPSPAERARWPLVIDYYRCPGFLRGGVGDETPLLPLASEGVATLCVNAVFAAGAQNSRQDYAAALSGIQAIVGKLSAAGVIDPKRVGMAGLSFGSEVVLWVARHSSLLAAASIASGQLEPGYYWYNAVRGRDVPEALAEAWGLGDPDHDRAAWAEVSPALDMDNIHAPLLMQLPELEARWSMQLYAKLSRSDTPVELYAFPDAAHVKNQPRQKFAAYTRGRDWFDFWLAGRTDGDPGKSEQYTRWRALDLRRAGRTSAQN